jgi:hypothetical protein
VALCDLGVRCGELFTTTAAKRTKINTKNLSREAPIPIAKFPAKGLRPDHPKSYATIGETPGKVPV